MLTRLAVTVVATVLALVTVEVAWTAWTELREGETLAVQRVVRDMTLLQTTIDFALAAGAIEQVDRELTARGADPDIGALLLVDDAGYVVGSRLRHEVGQPIAAVLETPPPTDMMVAARTRQIGTARLTDDRRAVEATYPVVLGLRSGAIRADRIGVLVARHSLERKRREVLAGLARRATGVTVVGLLGTGVLLWMGQALVGRRVRALLDATERFSAGGYDTRAGVGGPDEIGQIGAAFDAMAERVGETQRRVAESEERYRTLVEAAPVGIFRTDASGRVVDTNAAWRQLAGGDGRDWPDVVHPEDRPLIADWPDARVAGRPVQVDCRLLRPDGRVLWVHLAAVPERGGFIKTAVDLTERREAEEARARLEARLQLAQRLEALGTLAAGVAHDFNNVLAAILGFAGVLQRDVRGMPAAERHVDQVLRAGERGRGLVRQILSLGRGGPRVVREVALGALLEDVARLLVPALPANVRLRLDLDPDLRLLGDPDQLHRVFLNLGTNAWQAMRPGGGVLEIGARRLAADDERTRGLPRPVSGPHAIVWVHDEGCGMDRATVDRVFEPFFSTKPPGEGTGLGLTVVHGIVRAHGGGVLVDSVPGRGTTFSVFLPLAADVPAPPPPEPAVAPPDSPPHILYVDDDEDLCELARIAFERLGYRVSVYARARAALEAFRAAPDAFDLVVTDQRMPEMLGEELIAAILALRPGIPAILASGHVDARDIERIRAAGAREVVQKPMTVEELVQVCHRVLAAG